MVTLAALLICDGNGSSCWRRHAVPNPQHYHSHRRRATTHTRARARKHELSSCQHRASRSPAPRIHPSPPTKCDLFARQTRAILSVRPFSFQSFPHSLAHVLIQVREVQGLLALAQDHIMQPRARRHHRQRMLALVHAELADDRLVGGKELSHLLRQVFSCLRPAQNTSARPPPRHEHA